MRRLPSPAMVVALVALGIALGGSAVAATGLINGAQIRNHTVAAVKLTPQAVTALRGRPGPPGVAGTAKLQIVQSDPASVNPGQQGIVSVPCPAGSSATGGGGYASLGKLTLSGPGANGQQGWTVSVLNDTNVVLTTVRAYAVCAG